MWLEKALLSKNHIEIDYKLVTIALFTGYKYKCLLKFIKSVPVA